MMKDRVFGQWTTHQKRVQAMIFYPSKGKGKDQKGKGKEGAFPQSGLSASETPSEEGYSHQSDEWYSSLTDDSSCSDLRGTTAWYGTGHPAWMASVPLNLANHPTHVVLDLGCTRSIGSRTAIKRFQKYALYLGITTEFGPCNESRQHLRVCQLLFVQIVLPFLKTKKINLWCKLHPRKETVQEERASAAERSVPAQIRRRKGPPVWQDPSATLEQDVSGNSRERSEDVSILGKYPDGEALRNIRNKLSDERNLRDLHLKHYHMSTAQFQKRTTHLDIPGKVYDFYQHVVKTCSLCNSTKPRQDRSRVSGLRPEEFGDLIFLDHGSTKIGDNLWISDCFGWSDMTFNSVSM